MEAFPHSGIKTSPEPHMGEWIHSYWGWRASIKFVLIFLIQLLLIFLSYCMWRANMSEFLPSIY
jgi:hypothetical protein